MVNPHDAAMLDTMLNNVRIQEIKFIDLRFTDLEGVVRTITYRAEGLTHAHYHNGFNADVIGFKEAILMPDITTAFLDPFAVEKTMVIICNLIGHKEVDPRIITAKAIACLAKEELLHDLKFTFNVGFHIFDDVRFAVNTTHSFVKLDCYEFSKNNAKKYETGNTSHRNQDILGQTQPVDTMHDIRSEIALVLNAIGMHSLYHYHGSSSALCNIAYTENDLLSSADGLQILKYVTKNIINSYGKTATFMPKPIADAKGADFTIEHTSSSENLNYYLGGIMKHIKALNAFTNPTVNSYKRLSTQPELSTQLPIDKAIRSTFPDPSSNPYLALAAITMAGLDGIKNKTEPVHTLEHAMSLEEALSSLDTDRSFLCFNGVFTAAALDQYIAIQKNKLLKYQHTINPLDYELDYSC